MRARLFENLIESGLPAGDRRSLHAIPASAAIHAVLLTGAAAGPLLLSNGSMPEPAPRVAPLVLLAPAVLPPPALPSGGDPVSRPAVSRGTAPRLPVLTTQASQPSTPPDASGSGLTEAVPWTESSGTGVWLGEPVAGGGDRERTGGVTSAPIRVGGPIKEPRKLKHAAPRYPEIARAARVQGVVVLECVIDEQGRVREIKVVRGVPLLEQAAVEAVRQWVYTPTLLGGVAVPVVMTVTVNFRLS